MNEITKKQNNEITKVFLLMFISVIILGFSTVATAGEKIFSAGGDATSWSDDDNWSPAAEPTAADDVVIDSESAAVVCNQTYKAKSITLGGHQTSTLTSNNFIFGTISPDSVSDVAVQVRPDGTFTLQGAGVVTIQGQYKDSEETLVDEPSFYFWVK